MIYTRANPHFVIGITRYYSCNVREICHCSKGSELEELRKKVWLRRKGTSISARGYKNKPNEKIKEFERKLEDCEARATSAVEECNI